MGAYHALGRFDGSVWVGQHESWSWMQGYGLADRASATPNGPQTRFRISSMTKQFTAILILQVVESGELDLEASVHSLLPWYRESTGSRVTVRQLIRHTSGIPDGTERFRRDRPGAWPDGLRARIEAVGMGDLSFEPGSTRAYSNIDYWILGAILESVTGRSWEALLQERILDPLQMTNSGVATGAAAEALATGYLVDGDALRDEGQVELGVLHAAGQMFSTVEDLARFDAALHTDQLLGDAMRAEMFDPKNDPKGHALGWRVLTRTYANVDHPVRTTWNGGGYEGFASFSQRLFEDRIFLVMLGNSNTMRRPNDLRGTISDDIIRVVLGHPVELPVRKVPSELNRTTAKTHEGPWNCEGTLQHVLLDDDGLWWSRQGAYRADRLNPDNDGTWFLSNDHRETLTFDGAPLLRHRLKADTRCTRAPPPMGATTVQRATGVFASEDGERVCLWTEEGQVVQRSSKSTAVHRLVAQDGSSWWGGRLPRAQVAFEAGEQPTQDVLVERYKGSVTFRGVRTEGTAPIACDG